jgi:hypothetical protein
MIGPRTACTGGQRGHCRCGQHDLPEEGGPTNYPAGLSLHMQLTTADWCIIPLHERPDRPTNQTVADPGGSAQASTAYLGILPVTNAVSPPYRLQGKLLKHGLVAAGLASSSSTSLTAPHHSSLLGLEAPITPEGIDKGLGGGETGRAADGTFSPIQQQ